MKNIPSPRPSDDADESEWMRYFDAEEQRARENFVLTHEQLEALLDHLDVQLQHQGCNGTMQLTILWAIENRIDAEILCEQLGWFGGHCDDEVLMNCDQARVFG